MGELGREYGIGGSAGFNATSITRMQDNSYAPIIKADKLIPTSPPVASLSFDTVTLSRTTRAATVTDVYDDISDYVGKVGVLKIGSTVISNEAYCTGVSLKADAVFGYKKVWSFSAIEGSKMTYYDYIKNPQFEAGTTGWTTAAGAGGSWALTQVKNTEGIGSGSRMMKLTGPTTPSNTDTYMYQSIGVATADDTTDEYYLRLSAEVMFEKATTEQDVTSITIELVDGDSFSTSLFGTKGYAAFELVSNRPTVVSIDYLVGDLYHASNELFVIVHTNTSTGANDVMYISYLNIEELHVTEL